MTSVVEKCDVFIAGSGPIAATFARGILKERPNAKIIMCEIGSQDNPTMGAHHKNSIKYQKDIDAFVHVIQGALQPVSVPPGETHMSTLGDVAWTPPVGTKLIQAAHNPDQKREENLPGCAVTRTVGGMATHWTCACPRPRLDERTEMLKLMPELKDQTKFDAVYKAAEEVLCVSAKEYDHSIRHNIVKNALISKFGAERVESLPLAVKRNTNAEYVTWTGADTVLGNYAKQVVLKAETRVTKLEIDELTHKVNSALCRDLKSGKDFRIQAKKYVIACGAVCTPQILHNSLVESKALGKHLAEQSIAFCQIVLKRELVENISEKLAEKIATNMDMKVEEGEVKAIADKLKKKVAMHKQKNPNDPLDIPFNDPEPQVTMPYGSKTPYHTQIHRDAFSYGDVGPRADPRVIVDLRFFGKQDVKPENRIEFVHIPRGGENRTNTDLYGMPQATFFVKRSPEDAKRDHQMMLEMCEAANVLGAFLPGSYPQFMEPGLALHITGTTRLGTNPDTSVANVNSQLHNYEDIYVGGNGCIPDSTACNPTLTSVMYAMKAADHLAKTLPA